MHENHAEILIETWIPVAIIVGQPAERKKIVLTPRQFPSLRTVRLRQCWHCLNAANTKSAIETWDVGQGMFLTQQIWISYFWIHSINFCLTIPCIILQNMTIWLPDQWWKTSNLERLRVLEQCQSMILKV